MFETTNQMTSDKQNLGCLSPGDTGIILIQLTHSCTLQILTVSPVPGTAPGGCVSPPNLGAYSLTEFPPRPSKFPRRIGCGWMAPVGACCATNPRELVP